MGAGIGVEYRLFSHLNTNLEVPAVVGFNDDNEDVSFQPVSFQIGIMYRF
ncbi:MAG: hypothetical protein P9L91_09340 [Candidatus Zophobacter franzmannii]|nr:hypothetical protein [Candidatus Zophobacter franzmannii]